MSSHHRPTLKQVNKPFKGSSKRALKRRNKGKVADEAPRQSVKFVDPAGAKDRRKNLAKQLQKQKRLEALEKKRYGHGPPRLVALIPLGEKADPITASSLILQGCGFENANGLQYGGQTTVVLPKHKSRITLYVPTRELIPILDISKAADLILFIMHADEGVSDFGNSLLSQIFAQGMPAVMGIVTGLENVPLKRRNDVKKSAVSVFQSKFAEEPRICPLDNVQDAEQVVRFVCSQKLREIWRDGRPHLIAEHVEWVHKEGDFGTLKISGYIRGSSLDVNKLVHITDVGDFQLEKIELPEDPYPFGQQKISLGDSSMSLSSYSYHEPNSELQESLQAINIPDETANEQTWPTEEELAAAEAARMKKKKKVPKGFSEYQAAWIVDDESEEGDDDDGEDSEMEDAEDNGEGEEEEEEEDEEEEEGEDEAMDDSSIHDRKVIPGGKIQPPPDDSDSDISVDDALSVTTARSKYAQKEKTPKEEEEDDLMWPDEIDTPRDRPARFKFFKYRGLKSMRTSPWNPKQGLPVDYAKIYQFENFKRTMKRVLKSHTGVAAGTYVVLHIKDVHKDAFSKKRRDWPVLVSGLMTHEQKFSVVNLLVTKAPTYQEPIKTKDELVFQVGFRRYKARPIFSENTPGMNKFKMERFLHANRTSVASMYAPITYPPMSVLAWKELPDGSIQLAATGNIHSVDPDRIILKKIVLTGRVLKIKKRKAIVKDMFYNPEDVKYFQPVELWTKYGRTGQILEPVGTHGKMKCWFDSPITHQDTVCMSLYSRVFPQWIQYPTPIRPPEIAAQIPPIPVQ